MSVELLSTFVIPGLESLQRDVEDLLPDKSVWHTIDMLLRGLLHVFLVLFVCVQTQVEQLLENVNSKVQEYKRQEL